MRTARKQLGLFDGFAAPRGDPPGNAGWPQLHSEGTSYRLRLNSARHQSQGGHSLKNDSESRASQFARFMSTPFVAS